MKKIERSEIDILKKRLEEPRKFLISLSGPRQVGKTTMVHTVLKSVKTPHLYVTADGIESTNTGWIESQWETVRTKMRLDLHAEYILVIDEIQKIDNWSEVVKKCWDEDSRNDVNLKVIVLGSSRMLLQQGLTESMAGRFEQMYLGHWTYAEMQEAFDFTPEQYVWFGGYPGAAHLIGDENRWKDYIKYSLVDSSINRDILMLTRIDKPALLKRLFELGCVYSTQILAFNKILGQLQDAGNTVTLSHYLKLTDDAGLLGGLDKYSGSKVMAKASIPKFQVYNNALFGVHHHQSVREAQLDTTLWGRAVESAVGAHLMNYKHKYRYELYYWREQNDEIDFVLVYKGKTIGIEVKSSGTSFSKGIEKFKKLHSPDKVLLVGNSGIPWQDFLKYDPVLLF